MPKIDPRDLHDCLADDRSDATTHNPHTRTHARTQTHTHTLHSRTRHQHARHQKRGIALPKTGTPKRLAPAPPCPLGSSANLDPEALGPCAVLAGDEELGSEGVAGLEDGMHAEAGGKGAEGEGAEEHAAWCPPATLVCESQVCILALSLSLSHTHTHERTHTHTHMHTHTSKTSLMLEAGGRMGQNLRPCTDHGARHANDGNRARISKHDRRTAAVVPVEFRERQSLLSDSSGAALVRPASEHGLQHRWAHAGNSLPLTKQT